MPAQLSFNPVDARLVCASGHGRLAVWKLSQTDRYYAISSTEPHLPENAAGLRPHCHAWAQQNVLLAGCEDGEVVAFDADNVKPLNFGDGQSAIIYPSSGVDAAVTAIALNSRYMFVATQAGTIALYTNLASSKKGGVQDPIFVKEISLGLAEVMSIEMKPTFDAMLVSLSDGTSQRLDLAVIDPENEIVDARITLEEDAHAGLITGLSAPGRWKERRQLWRRWHLEGAGRHQWRSARETPVFLRADVLGCRGLGVGCCRV